MTTQDFLKLAKEIRSTTNDYDAAMALTELYYKGKADERNEVLKLAVGVN